MRKLSFSAALVLATSASIGFAQSETTCTSTLADRVNFLNSGAVTQNVKMRQSWDCPPVSENDKYGFTLDWDGPGKPIWMADPTIVWVKGSSQSEGWYYITGTCDDLGLGNFMIYKTKDFRHFFAHKLAFSDYYEKRDNGAVVDRILVPHSPTSGTNQAFGALMSPHLFVDPAYPNEVHIYFTATHCFFAGQTLSYSSVQRVGHWDQQSHCGDQTWNLNPLFPWDGYWEGLYPGNFDVSFWWDRIITCTTSDNEARTLAPQVIFYSTCFQSIFAASMPIDEFVSPSGTHSFTTDNRGIRPLAYRVDQSTTDYKFDGGQSLSGGNRYIPTWAIAYNYHDCSGTSDVMAAHGYINTIYHPFGKWHRKINDSTLNIWSKYTSVTDGACAFFDPNDLSTCSSSQGWLFYGWSSIGTMGEVNILERGNHIAGAKLQRCIGGSPYSNDWEFSTAIESTVTDSVDSKSSLSEFACPKNVNEKPDGNNYNGVFDSGANVNPRAMGVAESPSVIWDAALSKYVISYSRNFWDSPSYCVMYRTAANNSQSPGVKNLRLTSRYDVSSTEHMLVSSKLYKGANQDPYNFRGVPYGRSYGSAEFFYFRKPDGCYVVDSNGQKMLGIIFHAKLDGESRRTVFFKNLTRSNGLYSELIENHPSGAAGTDTWKFQVPKYCFADINKNGFVNGADYDEFVDLFDAGNPLADINGDGAVNGNDFDFFSLCFDEGC